MEIPTWWLVVSAVFFVLGSLLLIVLIAVAIYVAQKISALFQKVNSLSQRVETVSGKVEDLVASAKEVTLQARGVTSTLGGIATSSAHKLEIITTILFAIGALGKMRRSMGARKKK
ncbi:MAG: hypothetical protein K1X67_04305 [Fimbriimonadaceae bacterium]|nr:hypothetical protein [Fimbriimonadaceae bacterium]